MRIVCPGCAAEYEVPSSSLHPRRKARCTRCGGEWLPVQDAQIVAPDVTRPTAVLDRVSAVAAPDDSTLTDATLAGSPATSSAATSSAATGTAGARDRLAASGGAAARRFGALQAAWAASLLLLAGSTAAAVTWRAQVTRAWPPSAWLLGMPAPALPVPAVPAARAALPVSPAIGEPARSAD